MIWKQFTHLEHFPPKLKSRFNSFLTTEFDDSISVEMQLRSVIKWCQGNFKTVDTLIDFINELSNWLKQFETDFDTKLEDSVISVLTEWQANGKLDDIISEVLQTQLDDYIATNEQDKLSLTTQLQQTEQSLNAQLAQNARATTLKSKNLLDYSPNLFDAFNLAMSDPNHKVFHLDGGIHTTTGSLIFARGKKLLFNADSVIQTTNPNEPVFIMNRECELLNPTIDVSNIEYFSSAILFDGDNFDCENAIVDNPKILGSYGVGSKGIEFRATKDDHHYTMYNQVNNLYIWHFHYGVYTNAQNGGFCTGNVVNGRIFGCSHLVYLKGASGGNRFDVMLQSGVQVGAETQFYGIYCEGSFNEFNGFVWDIDPNLTNNYCFFTETSVGNTLSMRPYTSDGSYTNGSIIDEGDRNTVGNLIPYQNVFLPPIHAPKSGGGSLTMLGNQDNLFAYLDKNNNMFSLMKEFVGVSEIHNATYTPSKMFEPNIDVSMLSFSDPVNGYARYTVNISEPQPILSVGVGFDSSTANTVIQLYKDEVLVAEKVLPRKNKNKNIGYDNLSVWNVTLDYNGVNDSALRQINKVVVTFKNPYGSTLFITSLFASSSNNGNTYLSKDGGDVFGDVEFITGNGVVVVTPDGLNKYRIGVDNTGAITSTILPPN